MMLSVFDQGLSVMSSKGEKPSNFLSPRKKGQDCLVPRRLFRDGNLRAKDGGPSHFVTSHSRFATKVRTD